MSLLLVIDDDEDKRLKLAEAIISELETKTHDVEVLEFQAPAEIDIVLSYEGFMLEQLKLYDGEINFIACDKELGRYAQLRGFSALPVAAAAAELGIPFCQFSRRMHSDELDVADLGELRQWGQPEITLAGRSIADQAKEIVSLLTGFIELENEYVELASESKSPSSSLARILKHVSLEDKIALYGSGDQEIFREIMGFHDLSQIEEVEILQKRMPRVLGNWLFSSLLRFPGLLLNEVAAASFLDIAVQEWQDTAELRALFESCRYLGPFQDHPQGPWWWRDDLESLFLDEGKTSGRTYANSKGFNVSNCIDPVNQSPAGYYCMLTQAPVSLDNSRGDVNWFPAGADLARIQNAKYHEYDALIGMS